MIGAGYILIADEDALSNHERLRLEEKGFFVIRKKFGRNIEVMTLPMLPKPKSE